MLMFDRRRGDGETEQEHHDELRTGAIITPLSMFNHLSTLAVKNKIPAGVSW